MVLAVSIKDGRLLWTSDVGVGFSVNSTPAAIAGSLVFGTNGGDAVAIGSRDGAIRWRTRMTEPCIAAAHAVGANVVMYTDTAVWWLRASDDRVVAKWSSGGPQIKSFGVVGNRVFVVASQAETARLLVLNKGRVMRELTHPGFAMSGGLRYEPARDVVFDTRIIGLGLLHPRTAERLVDIHGFDEPLGMPMSTRSMTFVAEGGAVYGLDNKLITPASGARVAARPNQMPGWLQVSKF